MAGNDEEAPCMERACWVMAYQLLLGPLRPNASVCVHGHRFVLDEMVPPWPDEVQAQASPSGAGTDR